MDMHPAVVLELMDRLVDSVSEPAIKTTWEGLRRTVQITTSSTITLQHLMVAGEEGNRVDSLHQRIESLKQQVNDLTSEKANLEAQIAELRERLRQIGLPAPSDDGFYTMEQFLAVLTIKLRRSYGWRTDYVAASQVTEGCTPVQNDIVQKWQNTGRVPKWAVDQIDRLDYRKRTGIGGIPWSDENEEYLAARYLADPLQSNQSLAEQCETQFNRPINVPSVKGAIDRLRKKNRISLKRPVRVK